MKFILGKKLKMERIYLGDRVTAVTVVSAGPCQVVQCKTNETDKYTAAQIGFGYAKKLNKPMAGQVKGLANFKYLKEFRLDPNQTVTKGQVLNVGMFAEGERVKVVGVSKGKGFQGVVKRHGFHGHPATHGHKDQERMPGSIGSTDSGRVFKGVRMGGHMGDETVTITNLKIVKIDSAKNLLYIAGALPGATDGLLFIKAEGVLPEVSRGSC
jgi:large subunit ribosomal protein L3